MLVIPDLTTGCLIRLRRDVNDDVAIFTKFSLVFPCGYENPKVIFILGKMMIKNLLQNAIFGF